MSGKNTNRRLPLAKSILVWVSGAVLGWVVTVVSVYYVIRTDNVVASKEEVSPTAIGDAAHKNDQKNIAKDKSEQLEPIEPASGPNPGATPNGISGSSPEMAPKHQPGSAPDSGLEGSPDGSGSENGLETTPESAPQGN